MGAVNGRLGGVELGTGLAALKLLVFRWSASMDREVYDATAFNPTANARSKVGGLWDMRGTCEGYLDSTSIFDMAPFTSDASSAAFVLTSHTGRGYQFKGIITSFGPAAGVGEVGRFSCSFEADGNVTIV